MAKRKRIALIYAYSENWIGGTYYIENLISALSQLPDSNKPKLFIFTADIADIERLKKAVQYPYWSFRQFERTLSLPERVINKITAEVIGRRFISLLYSDIDLVFPLSPLWMRFFARVPHHLYWIPDFQEHYLPVFFTSEEIKQRKDDQELVVQNGKDIVFSSYAAQQDFNTIYPSNILRQHVLQFAVTAKRDVIQSYFYLEKYDIKQPYFICSNQFWKHKNHLTVLKALAIVRHTHPDILIIFTGKEHDYRNPTYFKELMDFRDEIGVQNESKFLGFIPREDQLALMQAARAVLQPSLFEGWSTVIEDAKSLNTTILASSINVHEEQLVSYGSKLFFTPEDDVELANCMIQLINTPLASHYYDYGQNVVRFASEFLNVIQTII